MIARKLACYEVIPITTVQSFIVQYYELNECETWINEIRKQDIFRNPWKTLGEDLAGLDCVYISVRLIAEHLQIVFGNAATIGSSNAT